MRPAARILAALGAYAASLFSAPAWADAHRVREQPLTLAPAIERIDPLPVRGEGLAPRLRLGGGVEAAAGAVRASAALALRLSSRVEFYAEAGQADALGVAEPPRGEPAVVSGRMAWRVGGVALALESVNLFDTEDRNLAYIYATRGAGDPYDGAAFAPIIERSFRVQAKLRF